MLAKGRMWCMPQRRSLKVKAEEMKCTQSGSAFVLFCLFLLSPFCLRDAKEAAGYSISTRDSLPIRCRVSSCADFFRAHKLLCEDLLWCSSLFKAFRSLPSFHLYGAYWQWPDVAVKHGNIQFNAPLVTPNFQQTIFRARGHTLTIQTPINCIDLWWERSEKRINVIRWLQSGLIHRQRFEFYMRICDLS